MKSIGIDIEDISRFENKTLEKDPKFLFRIFTQREITYCLKDSNSSSHFAVRYCAKEAVVKALCSLTGKKIPYNKIEILNDDNNAPYVNILQEEFKDYNFLVSLSHEKQKAVAMVAIV